MEQQLTCDLEIAEKNMPAVRKMYNLRLELLFLDLREITQLLLSRESLIWKGLLHHLLVKSCTFFLNTRVASVCLISRRCYVASLCLQIPANLVVVSIIRARKAQQRVI